MFTFSSEETGAYFYCSQVIALSGIDNLHTQGWRRLNIKRYVCAADVNK